MQTLGENEGENPELEDSDDEEGNTGGTSSELAQLEQGWLISSPTEDRIAFEIDRSIDITSKALLDMISDDSVATENAARAPATSKPEQTIPNKNISVTEAFENW